jgi:glycosyltransferase involved in cell wall biosynthesis
MKIAYLCSDPYVPLFGAEGCSIHVREFTNALVEQGHDVIILCADADGTHGRAETRARVHSLSPRALDAAALDMLDEEPAVQAQQLQWNLRSIVATMRLEGEAWPVIERERPDVIVERHALFGWAGLELSARADIPLVLEVNAPLCREQPDGALPLRGLAERMESEVLRRADAVLVVSRWLADWATSRGADDRTVHVLPNGVAERLFGGTASGGRMRTQWGLLGARVVGYVGSFQPWHDLDGLLAAFAVIHRQQPDVRLLLVGDGPARSTVAAHARRLDVGDAVVFAGAMPHERIPEALAAMDVAVAPYDAIPGFYFSPLKLVESMAGARPTVAAAVGQIAEVIEHGATGWLYPPGDHAALVTALTTLLSEPERAARIGAAGRRKILAERTWRAVAARAVEIAAAVVESRAGARGAWRWA